MSYQVTAPLVVIPNDDKKTGDGYFYADAIVPDGWNDERCKQLAKEGMLEKVKESKPKSEPTGPNPGTADFILKEVGTDKAKAQAALDEENAKGESARKTLVADLEKVLAG